MTKIPKTRRGKGRPIAAENGVGRDALIDATRKLLQELPPSQVTIAAVGREAGVDPALIRYYFGGREALLFEVAQQIAAGAAKEADYSALTVEQRLEAFIHGTFAFSRSAKYMQRLMADELSSAKSPEMQDQLRAWQRTPLGFYEELQATDSEGALNDYDPLFLHLAMTGISDFFHSGAAVVKMLAPEGADLADLEKRYEDFVAHLLLNGLRRRKD